MPRVPFASTSPPCGPIPGVEWLLRESPAHECHLMGGGRPHDHSMLLFLSQRIANSAIIMNNGCSRTADVEDQLAQDSKCDRRRTRHEGVFSEHRNGVPWWLHALSQRRSPWLRRQPTHRRPSCSARQRIWNRRHGDIRRYKEPADYNQPLPTASRAHITPQKAEFGL